MSANRRALFGLAAMALGAVAARGEPSGLALRNLEPSGAFEVSNLGPDARLSARVRIELLWRGAWTEWVADLRLARACEPPPACVTLSAGESLRPPPWNGYSCGGQCPASCRANVLAPPGTYRFALQDCSGVTLVHGAPFVRP